MSGTGGSIDPGPKVGRGGEGGPVRWGQYSGAEGFEVRGRLGVQLGSVGGSNNGGKGGKGGPSYPINRWRRSRAQRGRSEFSSACASGAGLRRPRSGRGRNGGRGRRIPPGDGGRGRGGGFPGIDREMGVMYHPLRRLSRPRGWDGSGGCQRYHDGKGKAAARLFCRRLLLIGSPA